MKFLKVIFVAFVLFEVVLVAKIFTKQTKIQVFSQNVSPKYSSVVRLHDVTTGNFTCSGTVVSPTRIVTAAHCLMVPPGYPPTYGFEIRGQDNVRIGVFSTVMGANPRSDLAVLAGNFKLFDTRKLQNDPREIIEDFMGEGNRLETCGYPEGGPLFCYPIKDPRQFSFGFMARGFMWPGMSGGPIINKFNDEVIAVNTAVMSNDAGDTHLILSPTINTFSDTHTQE